MYIHVEMKYVWVFSLVTLVLSVSGCAGMSHRDNARFQAVVAKNVSVGMPFVTAIEHLAKAGFHCGATSDAADVTCTRVEFSLLPFSCVQRVNVSSDTYRNSVVAVTPEPIACASL
jgi:hypothetical protein